MPSLAPEWCQTSQNKLLKKDYILARLLKESKPPKLPELLFSILCFPGRAGGGEGKPLAVQIGWGLWFRLSWKILIGQKVKNIFSMPSMCM